MRLPILTALPGSELEASLVEAAPGLQLHVVRRCVDLADLLAAAHAGLAQAAVISGQLRHLDRESLLRLAVNGVAVVGVVSSDADERRLRQMGLSNVLAAEASPAELSAALRQAVAGILPQLDELRDASHGESAAQGTGNAEADSTGAELAEPGQVIAVWGPTGAPGRSTTAASLAAALAAAGQPTLLIDADVYGGALATMLGVLDESAGLAAACRSANSGSLDVATLAAHARDLGGGLRLLSGLARADRWAELRASSVEAVLETARRLAAVVVVDCGFSLERDDDGGFDSGAPRRNAATTAVLAAADTVIAVGAADPVGLSRLVRALPELRLLGCPDIRIVATKAHGDLAQVSRAITRLCGSAPAATLPADHAACLAAMEQARPVVQAAPGSALAKALTQLAASLLTEPGEGPAGDHNGTARRRPGARRRLGRRIAKREPVAAAEPLTQRW